MVYKQHIYSEQSTTSLPLVLIINDDENKGYLLRQAMEKEGYQVIEAKDGEKGLAIYNHTHPGIILLNTPTPRRSGFSFCAHLHLHNLPGARSLPLLTITSLDHESYLDFGYDKAGVAGYINKLIHWPLLGWSVRRLLQANNSGATKRRSLAAIGYRGT